MVRNELFESPHIGRMFLRLAVPGSIGMLASAIYQFIDGIFVNNFLGSAAFAAVNFSFPFLIAAYAVSDLFGVGSSVVLSLKLGQKKGEEANRIFTATVLIILAANIIVASLLLATIRPILSAVGAQGEVEELAFQYLLPSLCLLPLSGFFFSFDNFLRISGKVKYSMSVNVVSSLFIIGIEYLLLGVLKVGIWGASLSSAMCFSAAALTSMVPFFAKKTILAFAKPHIERHELSFLIRSGLPAFLANIAGRITSIVINAYLVKVGGNDAVSAYGSVLYIDGFIYPLLYGMCDSLQPCLSYNHGAGRKDRVKKLQKYVFLVSFSFCFICFMLLCFMPNYLTYPFLSDGGEELLKLGAQAGFFFSFLYIFRAIPYACSNLFQAVGRPIPAVTITLCLSLVFPMILLGCFIPLGLIGVWINAPVTYALGSILAGLLFYFLIVKDKHKEDILEEEK